jgi:hypothetical protein
MRPALRLRLTTKDPATKMTCFWLASGTSYEIHIFAMLENLSTGRHWPACLLASCASPFHTARAISAALGSIFAISELLRHMCPLESATNIVSRWPGTYRYWYHNIRNILYKLVLNFYLKFCSSRSGRSWSSSSARPGLPGGGDRFTDRIAGPWST